MKGFQSFRVSELILQFSRIRSLPAVGMTGSLFGFWGGKPGRFDSGLMNYEILMRNAPASLPY